MKVVDGKLERDFKPAFVNGSSNFKHSALAEHDGNECHKKAKRWQEYEQAVATGEALPKKQIAITVHHNAQIKSGMNKMQETEKETLAKLFNTAYFIAEKGPPFTDFTYLIALQKVNGMDFNTY